jgi:hypothetical protein
MTRLAWGAFWLLAVPAAAAGPRVDVVVSKDAPRLERLAAEDVASDLTRLFDAETRLVDKPGADVPHVIFVGSPATNAPLRNLKDRWPTLAEQEHVVHSLSFRGRPALWIGGGSPAAVFWAASELAHHWGVRSLLYGDLDPIAPPPFSLEGIDVTLDPYVDRRAWVIDFDSMIGPQWWGRAEHKRLLQQLARLKFNLLVVSFRPWQPFVHFEFDGVSKQTGVLALGRRFPTSGDTAGRTVFNGAPFFENPDFKGAQSYDQRIAAGQALLKGIIDQARELGMAVAIDTSDREFPKEFAPCLPGSVVIATSEGLGIAPAADTPDNQDPLARLAAAQRQALIEAYPGVDHGPLPDRPAMPVVGGSGLLPRIVHASIPDLLNRLADPSKGGVAIRGTLPGDLDLDAYQLCRAGFDSRVDSDTAAASLLSPVCGEGVADCVNKARASVAEAVAILETNEPDFDFPAADVLLRHYGADHPPPAWWNEVRDRYLAAMNEMYRANTRARDGGRSFTLYLARRYEFAFELINCLEAARKAGLARRAAQADLHVSELEKAVESANAALGALAAVARSQTDRATIAVLNDFAYRPLVKQLEDADQAQPRPAVPPALSCPAHD